MLLVSLETRGVVTLPGSLLRCTRGCPCSFAAWKCSGNIIIEGALIVIKCWHSSCSLQLTFFPPNKWSLINLSICGNKHGFEAFKQDVHFDMEHVTFPALSLVGAHPDSSSCCYFTKLIFIPKKPIHFNNISNYKQTKPLLSCDVLYLFLFNEITADLKRLFWTYVIPNVNHCERKRAQSRCSG